jgi:hypothetical protein
MEIRHEFCLFTRLDFFIKIIFDEQKWNLESEVENCAQNNRHNDVAPEFVELRDEVKVERLLL